MKALVVEIKEKEAVVLMKNGSFSKIRNDGTLSIGCEAEIPEAKVVRFPKMLRLASAAAVFVLVAGMGYGAYSYSVPYSYVSVDINPSIEITANIYDKIIRVKPVNTDGKNLIEDINLKNKSLSEGVEKIVNAAIDEGYLKPEAANDVMISVVSSDNKKVESLKEKIEQTASEQLEDASLKGQVLIEKSSKTKHDEASKMGMTAGKLTLIEKLEEVKPGIEPDEYKNTSVKDLIKEINEAGKASKDKGKALGNKQDDDISVINVPADTTANEGSVTMNGDTGKLSPGQEKKSEGKGKVKDKKSTSDETYQSTTGSQESQKDTSTKEATGDKYGKAKRSKDKKAGWIEKKVQEILESVGIAQPEEPESSTDITGDTSQKHDKSNDNGAKGNNGNGKGSNKGKD